MGYFACFPLSPSNEKLRLPWCSGLGRSVPTLPGYLAARASLLVKLHPNSVTVLALLVALEPLVSLFIPLHTLWAIKELKAFQTKSLIEVSVQSASETHAS